MVNPLIALLGVGGVVWLMKLAVAGTALSIFSIFANPLVIGVIFIWVAIWFLRK